MATSEIYIYNSPAVFPKEASSDEVIISVGGSQSKDGKRVVKWSNLAASQSWIIDFHFEESGTDNGETYYYYFTVEVAANTSVKERTGYCYVDYQLEDGETGTASIKIIQEPNNGIIFDGSNPLVWQVGNNREYSPTITYSGVTNSSKVSTPTISSGWGIVATYGTVNGNAYSIDYDIWPEKYNVTNKDKISSVTFQYTNASSVKVSRTLYLNQKGCVNPFGFTYNGNEIETEGLGTNNIKTLRNIPFTNNTIVLRCYFPYLLASNTINFSLDFDDVATLVNTKFNTDSSGISYIDYELEFLENTVVSNRSVKATVDYICQDGTVYSDRVRLIQNASDGSNLPPEISLNKSVYKVKYDGTPEMSGDEMYRVRFINLYPDDAYTDADWIHLGNKTVLEGFDTNAVLWGFPVTYDENKSDEPRTATVMFRDLNGLYAASINVTQARYNKDVIDTPDIPVEGGEYIGQIWKDVEYNFGGVDTVEYSIYHNGNKIFAGRSCKRPNNTSNKIMVNKICQNYLTVPELKKDIVSAFGGYEEFDLMDVNGTYLYKKYKFVNDWSYSNDFKTGILSHPILNDNDVYYGQLLPFSVFAAAEQVKIEYGIRYMDSLTDDYGKPIEDWEQTGYYKDEVITEMFPYSGRNYKGGVRGYYIGDKFYPIVDDCKVDYVLYYINPWGGYDWFPIRGKVVENDELTQYNYVQNYNNQTWEFGKRRYLSEINKKFQLNTHWLREDESSRMWYLIQSNTVYLHNIKDNIIYPVVITNTSQEHKKRGIISNRISYQIEVELSQVRERL